MHINRNANISFLHFSCACTRAWLFLPFRIHVFVDFSPLECGENQWPSYQQMCRGEWDIILVSVIVYDKDEDVIKMPNQLTLNYSKRRFSWWAWLNQMSTLKDDLTFPEIRHLRQQKPNAVGFQEISCYETSSWESTEEDPSLVRCADFSFVRPWAEEPAKVCLGSWPIEIVRGMCVL